MNRTRGETVNFNDAPPSEESSNQYKSIIDRAKKKGRAKPKAMEGTPRFDELPEKPIEVPPGVQQKEHLSPQTAAGLEAVARATAQRQQADELEEEEEKKPVILSEDERLRAAIEGRIAPIDIGQYFLGGELTQTVPIIPDQLVVRFRSVDDLEEVFVDEKLKSEGTEHRLSDREFVRRTNEWALATHVHTFNGIKWPPVLDGNGTVSEKAMAIRMDNVRKIPSPVFTLLSKNLQWFLERVNDSLTLAALGNG